MNQQTEAMKLALKALEHLQPTALTSFYTIGDRDKAITALQKALAQPQQEPVASLYDDGTWIAKKTEAGRALNDRLLFAGSPAIDVYTRPQAQQQDFSDAYQGAREDLAMWKKRALAAEELNRKFIADINGQTFMGEPAQQEPVAEVLRGWKLNHAQQESEGNPGMWEVGHLNEDDVFSPVITINTGLYYQDADAEPMARAVLAAITSPPAQPQQEPVLMFYEQEWQGKTSRAYQWLIDPFSLPAGTKLYTSPSAQRKPLTERELMKCITQAKCFGTVTMTYESGPYEIDRPTPKAFQFARAIEAAQGIAGEKK